MDPFTFDITQTADNETVNGNFSDDISVQEHLSYDTVLKEIENTQQQLEEIEKKNTKFETLKANEVSLDEKEKTELQTLISEEFPRDAQQSQLKQKLEAQQKKLDEITNDLVERHLLGEEIDTKNINAKIQERKKEIINMCNEQTNVQDFTENCVKYNQLIEGDLQKKFNELLEKERKKRAEENKLTNAIISLQSQLQLSSNEGRYYIFAEALNAYKTNNLSQFPKWSKILNISELETVPTESQKLYIETMDNLKKELFNNFIQNIGNRVKRIEQKKEQIDKFAENLKETKRQYNDKLKEAKIGKLDTATLQQLNVLIQTNEQRLEELQEELIHLQDEKIKIEEEYDEIETKKQNNLGKEYNWFVDFQNFSFNEKMYTNFSYDQELLGRETHLDVFDRIYYKPKIALASTLQRNIRNRQAMKKMQESKYQKQIDECLKMESFVNFETNKCNEIGNTDVQLHGHKLSTNSQRARINRQNSTINKQNETILERNQKVSELENENKQKEQDLNDLKKELSDNQSQLVEQRERELQEKERQESEERKRIMMPAITEAARSGDCLNTSTTREFKEKKCDELDNLHVKNYFEKLSAKKNLLQKIKDHPKKAVAGVAVVGIGGVLVYNYVLPKPKPKKKSKKRSM